MLKKIRIKNFLSCEDTEFDLEQITVLIGRNAAGKSNILKAIEWFSQFAVGNVLLDEYNKHLVDPYPLIPTPTLYNIEFLINDSLFKYDVNINNGDILISESISLLKYDKWELIARRKNDQGFFYTEKTSGIKSLLTNNSSIKKTLNFGLSSQSSIIYSISSLLPKKILTTEFNTVFDYLSEIKYYTLESSYNPPSNLHSHIVSHNEYKQWKKGGGDNNSVVMRLLDLWYKDKETLQELQDIVGIVGLNLIELIYISQNNYSEQSKQDFFYVVNFGISDFGKANIVVNYNQLSYGTQRVLIILLALLYDKNSTLLIEQPEDGIHIGLLRKVLSICFEYAEVYNKQLIITTHSPDVIDMLQPENIRFVKMTEHGTKVSCLDRERLPFVHEYIKEKGALSDLIESMDECCYCRRYN